MLNAPKRLPASFLQNSRAKARIASQRLAGNIYFALCFERMVENWRLWQ